MQFPRVADIPLSLTTEVEEGLISSPRHVHPFKFPPISYIQIHSHNGKGITPAEYRSVLTIMYCNY